MASIPSKVKERLSSALKRFQPIVAAAKARDVNESNTVTIVTDLLAEAFGYDKYSEITSEYSIRGTYVDLAIKIDNAPQMLVEVKAIGLELKDAFVKQAVDYAANQGVEWVVLTNAAEWHVYRVSFGKPIDQELVLRLDFLQANAKSDESLEGLFLLTREALGKAALGDYHAQRQALSRYFIGAMLLGDPVVAQIRRELRRLSPDVRVDDEEIRQVLLQDVLKRDVVEGEKADEARKKIARAAQKAARKASVKDSGKGGGESEDEPVLADDATASEAALDGNE